MSQPVQHAIVVNDERKLSARDGETLLAALMAQGIFIPSACGGHAACGMCRVKVKEGGGEVTPAETAFLSEKDQANQLRLACQLVIRDDLSIDLPRQFFTIRDFTVPVVRIVELTQTVREFTLRLPEGETMKFIPGQYVMFRIPEYDGARAGVYRAFSMASTQAELPDLRFIIRRTPEGIGTTWLFDHLKEGQPVEFHGPYGRFKLRDRRGKAVFVAGGVGLSAIYALLRQLAERESTRPVDLFFGTRTVDELFYLDQLRDVGARLPNLRFVPSVARRRDGDGWQGEVGLVTDVLDRWVGPGEIEEAYLCGCPRMIDECVKVLARKGIGTDRIFCDRFL